MKAVVFDVDGVLVDSEPHSRRAWVEVLGSHGVSITTDDVEAFTGSGFSATYDGLVGDAEGLPSPESIWPELQEALARSFGEGLRVFEDAADALRRLAFEGVPVAVATASPRSRLDLTLEQTDLGRFVMASAAGDEVDRSKPAPDVYLLAAERLGTEPGRCVAVEDTPTGARSALAAGMRVMGVARRPEDVGPLLRAGAAASSAVDYDALVAWLD
ncbi:MAG: HAD family phosphatase [Acidimicrobiia bacterium]|nr:HAD family phosphatase [Acidimicrobiia bacterium]